MHTTFLSIAEPCRILAISVPPGSSSTRRSGLKIPFVPSRLAHLALESYLSLSPHDHSVIKQEIQALQNVRYNHTWLKQNQSYYYCTHMLSNCYQRLIQTLLSLSDPIGIMILS